MIGEKEMLLKDVHVGFRVDGETDRALAKIAELSKKKKSLTIREALNQYIRNYYSNT